MNEDRSVAGAYLKIEGHERLCEERHKTIDGKLDALSATAANNSKILMGVLLALIGWMGVTLWEGRNETQTSTTTTTVSAPVRVTP